MTSEEPHAVYMRMWQAQHPGYGRESKRAWRRRNAAQHNEAVKAWRRRTGANKAHCAIRRALQAGTLVRPDACGRCGRECKPEASHDDYSRPLEVEWLCRRCHADKDIRIKD